MLVTLYVLTSPTLPWSSQISPSLQKSKKKRKKKPFLRRETQNAIFSTSGSVVRESELCVFATSICACVSLSVSVCVCNTHIKAGKEVREPALTFRGSSRFERPLVHTQRVGRNKRSVETKAGWDTSECTTHFEKWYKKGMKDRVKTQLMPNWSCRSTNKLFFLSPNAANHRTLQFSNKKYRHCLQENLTVYIESKNTSCFIIKLMCIYIQLSLMDLQSQLWSFFNCKRKKKTLQSIFRILYKAAINCNVCLRPTARG